jgi:hypothetical protein
MIPRFQQNTIVSAIKLERGQREYGIAYDSDASSMIAFETTRFLAAGFDLE